MTRQSVVIIASYKQIFDEAYLKLAFFEFWSHSSFDFDLIDYYNLMSKIT